MYRPVGKGRICEGKKFSHPLPPINKIAGFFSTIFFSCMVFHFVLIFMMSCDMSSEYKTFLG